MQSRLFYRTAFKLASLISIVLNVIVLLAFLHFQNEAIPASVKEILQSPLPLQAILQFLIFNLLFIFVFSFILYVLNFKLLSVELKPKIRNILRTVSTFIVALFLNYLFWTLYYGDILIPNLASNILIASFILLNSHLKYVSYKQQQTALENKTLITENMRTRYEALKNQVDPHFLFNSLNTLNTLIKIDADKAQQYVQELSHVFRYTLQNREIISLEEELKFTQAYGHLMQIRYGDCLRFEYQIDPRFYAYRILPLSLQTLVENAIKHNVVSAKLPLTVSLATGNEGTVIVSNTIQPKKELEKGEGVGLVNLVERYRLMWQREIIITQNDGIFRVEIYLLNT